MAQALPTGTARKFDVNLSADGKAMMTAYLAKHPTGRAVVILPGGGYSHLAIGHEGHDWAPFFNQQGIALFVVTYRMPAGNREIPMGDARQAMLTVRDSADAWGINPRDVGLMGSSAGGHLASTLATHEEYASRPNFSILFYPVISMEKGKGHEGSRMQFLGADADNAEVWRNFSNQNMVRRHLTPPAIIITANDDNVVPPVTNGIAYYSAMQQQGNDCTLHVYKEGGHGFGCRTSWPHHYQMMNDLTQWLRELPSPRKDAIRVACIGNSITNGHGIRFANERTYPAYLQQLLGDGYQVKNFGVNGRTLLQHGDQPYINELAWRDAQGFCPDVAIIKLGTNDSKPQNWCYKNEFEGDLQAMINTLKALPSHPKIFLCTPIPAFENPYKISEEVIGGEIKAMVERVAKKNKLTVIDLHSQVTDKALLQRDGVHPNEKGTLRMAEIISKAISGK